MNAIPYDSPDENWDSYEDESEVALPGRPRRKLLSWWSAALFALLLGVVGFYVGVRVEKNQLSSSTSTSTSAFSGGAGLGRAGAGAGAGAGAAGSRAGGAARGGGALRSLLGGGAGGAGANATFGTVSSVSGSTLYLTSTSGNTVKVTLSSATKVTKNV